MTDQKPLNLITYWNNNPACYAALAVIGVALTVSFLSWSPPAIITFMVPLVALIVASLIDLRKKNKVRERLNNQPKRLTAGKW